MKKVKKIKKDTLVNKDKNILSIITGSNTFIIEINNFSDFTLKNVDIINPHKFSHTNNEMAYIGGDLFFKNYKISCPDDRYNFKELNLMLSKKITTIKNIYVQTTTSMEFGGKIIYSKPNIHNKNQILIPVLDPYQTNRNCILLKSDFIIEGNSSVKLWYVKPGCKISICFYIEK